jgi:hypothetical protein
MLESQKIVELMRENHNTTYCILFNEIINDYGKNKPLKNLKKKINTIVFNCKNPYLVIKQYSVYYTVKKRG